MMTQWMTCCLVPEKGCTTSMAVVVVGVAGAAVAAVVGIRMVMSLVMVDTCLSADGSTSLMGADILAFLVAIDT